MTTPAFRLNGKPFPGSVWGYLLYKVCRGNHYAAGRIVYRARNADNPVAWIKQGLKPDENGDRYALLPCQDETERPGDVQAWIDAHVFKTKTRVPETMKSILRGIVDG